MGRTRTAERLCSVHFLITVAFIETYLSVFTYTRLVHSRVLTEEWVHIHMICFLIFHLAILCAWKVLHKQKTGDLTDYMQGGYRDAIMREGGGREEGITYLILCPIAFHLQFKLSKHPLLPHTSRQPNKTTQNLLSNHYLSTHLHLKTSSKPMLTTSEVYTPTQSSQCMENGLPHKAHATSI